MANPEWVVKMVEVVSKYKPKDCTGFYITSCGIIFGKRTNRKKAPKNFVFFEDPS